MNFELSTEQRLLQDSINKLVANEYAFEQRASYLREGAGYSQHFWQQLAENGFLMGPFSEAMGGMGFGAEETLLVMEALGGVLSLEPYRETVVTCGSLLRQGASPDQIEQVLPSVYGGELILALAATEKQSRFNLQDVATTAVKNANGFTLSGTKLVVPHGLIVNAFIVSARTSGGRGDPDGISLFLVAADSAGLERRDYKTQDGIGASDITLQAVQVSDNALIGPLGQGYTLLENAAEETIAAMAAEAVGAARVVLDLTVDYIKQRKQFGVAIGSFQALQHRCAEMLIETEQLRSMAIYGAYMLTSDNPLERAQAMSQVKLQTCKCAQFVAEQAIQLSGGIGVTEEYAVGHYLKRLRVMESRFGDRDYHLNRLAQFVKSNVGKAL